MERASRKNMGISQHGFFAPTHAMLGPSCCVIKNGGRFHDGTSNHLGRWFTTTRRSTSSDHLGVQRIDNASYYRARRNHAITSTHGTGNTLNLSNPAVIEMVTDSLRYWVNELHVTAFRFDLGTILAREPNGFDNQSAF